LEKINIKQMTMIRINPISKALLSDQLIHFNWHVIKKNGRANCIKAIRIIEYLYSQQIIDKACNYY